MRMAHTNSAAARSMVRRVSAISAPPPSHRSEPTAEARKLETSSVPKPRALVCRRPPTVASTARIATGTNITAGASCGCSTGRCGVGADADREKHVADLAHRRVREDALDVGLDDGDAGREKGSHRADDGNGAMRVNGYVVDGMHAADEVDACGDHGRGMDQGADG